MYNKFKFSYKQAVKLDKEDVLSDIEYIVERFKTKFSVSKNVENYTNQTLLPLTNKIFSENFSDVLKQLVENINKQVGTPVLTFIQETKDRTLVQGQFHRIFFQKNKLELHDNIASVSIIPIYVWKGVTKHLGPITYFVNTDTQEVKWDIQFDTVKHYAINLFNNLVDDKDFSM